MGFRWWHAVAVTFCALWALWGCSDGDRLAPGPDASAQVDARTARPDVGRIVCTGDACGCQVGAMRACHAQSEGTIGVGVCRAGMQRCVSNGEFGGAWAMCDGETMPSAERCDGEDDDCDGDVDEGCASPDAGIDADASGPIGTTTGDAGMGDAAPYDADPLGVPTIENACLRESRIQLPTGQVELTIDVPPAPPTCGTFLPSDATLPCTIDAPGPHVYVDASTGDDRNLGDDPSRAVATLWRGVALAPPGGSVLVAEGVYRTEWVAVTKGIVVKGGYDPTFTTWDPDAHVSWFLGNLTVAHPDAVFGGFHLRSRTPRYLYAASTAFTLFHEIVSGTLVRNVIDMEWDPAVSPPTSYVFALNAASPVGHTTVLRCNDITLVAPSPHSPAVELGNVRAHRGSAVIDGNRICNVDDYAIGGLGTCRGTCGEPEAEARVRITSNVLKSGRSSAINFWGCGADESDLEIVVASNTIFGGTLGIATLTDGLDSPPDSVLHWHLGNNVVVGQFGSQRSVDADLAINDHVIETSAGNLCTGFADNTMHPIPNSAIGDDVSGTSSASDLFFDFTAGDLRPRNAALLGVDLDRDPRLHVERDLFQRPRPAGSRVRGAILP